MNLTPFQKQQRRKFYYYMNHEREREYQKKWYDKNKIAIKINLCLKK